MLNPKVMVGECSIQVMLRGELMMTIPHRLWESGVSEEGEVVWSGELRGDHTTLMLVRYLEGKIQGCEEKGELFNRLDEVMGELKFSQWRKTMRVEGLEKKKEKEEKERRRKLEGREAPVERVARSEDGAIVRWRRAA